MGRLFGIFWELAKAAVKLGLVALIFLVLWVWFANAHEDTQHGDCGAPRPPIGIADLERSAPGYVQPESNTYLRFPESYIAHNGAEFARALASSPPSRLPYFRSAAQYWRSYYRVFKITQAKYSFKARDHLMPILAGAGFTVERVFKGVYENTVGRLSEWTAGSTSDEDTYAAAVAQEYANAVRSRPIYDFSYGRALTNLWSKVPLQGEHQARKVERRLILSVEYGAKAVYWWLMRLVARSDERSTRLYALVTDGTARPALPDARARDVARLSASSRLIGLPRDAAFTDVVRALATRGVTFVEIAGNDEIFLTALAPADWEEPDEWRVLVSEPVLTEPGRIRVALAVPVSCLRRVIDDLESRGATVERFYEF